VSHWADIEGSYPSISELDVDSRLSVMGDKNLIGKLHISIMVVDVLMNLQTVKLGKFYNQINVIAAINS